MMNCQDCAERLDEYLAAAWPAEVRAGVDEHLSSCGTCRAELEACRRLAESLKQLPRPFPGAEVCMRVSEAIHADTPPRPQVEYGPVLNVSELCAYLRVDLATLEQYLGEIPCFELGGRLLFRKAKVEEWIARRETLVGFAEPAYENPNGPSRRRVPWMLSQRN